MAIRPPTAGGAQLFWSAGLLTGLLIVAIAAAIWFRSPAGSPVVATAQAQAPAGRTGPDWPTVDAALGAAIAAARQNAERRALERLGLLVESWETRFANSFEPWFFDFQRRKIEEFASYNLHLWDSAARIFSGERPLAAAAWMRRTFDRGFEDYVLDPMSSRALMRQIGTDTARDFALQLSSDLALIRDRHGVPDDQWRRRIARLPTVQLDLGAWAVPLDRLIALDEGSVNALGSSIGRVLERRFAGMPPFGDTDILVDQEGRSIFSVGENAYLFYSSWAGYVIVLAILLQSGWISLRLFGALLGWLIWECFSWGTWIFWESKNFEVFREVLAPRMAAHAASYFANMRDLLADPGAAGPFAALYQVETALRAALGG
jgi:hypothetical protein